MADKLFIKNELKNRFLYQVSAVPLLSDVHFHPGDLHYGTMLLPCFFYFSQSQNYSFQDQLPPPNFQKFILYLVKCNALG